MRTLLLYGMCLCLTTGCGVPGKAPASSQPNTSKEAVDQSDQQRVVEVRLEVPQFSRSGKVPVSYSVPPVTRKNCAGIELWKTPDGGKSWHLHSHTKNLQGSMEIQLQEGEWGLKAVPVFKDGKKAGVPSPGDKPQSRIVIDRTPPAIRLGKIRVERSEKELLPEVETFHVHVPYSVSEKRPGSPALTALIASKNNQVWRKVHVTDKLKDTFSFPVSSFFSPVCLKLKLSDKAGNVTVKERKIWPRDILNPPQVEIVSPEKGSYLKGGGECLLIFKINWSNMGGDPFKLAYSSTGQTWRQLTEIASGKRSWTWEVPEEMEARVLLRLEVTGKTGRVIPAEHGPLFIDSKPPEAVILGPGTLSGREGLIHVNCRDPGEIASGVKRVAIYAQREKSEKVEKIASKETPCESLRVEFPHPGSYRVWVAAWDRCDNHSPLPPGGRPFLLQVAPKEGSLKVLTLREGGVVRAGSTHILAWKLPALSEPVESGEILMAGESRLTSLCTVCPLEGRHKVKFPAKQAGTVRFRLRIRTATGRVLEAETGTFRTDGDPPVVELFNANEKPSGLRIAYSIKDRGPAGLESTGLFLSSDGGHSWVKKTELDSSGETTLKTPQGLLGLYIAAQDKVGNSIPVPHEGTAPQRTVLAGEPQPEALTIVKPRGGERVRGGTTHHVVWRSRLSKGFLPPEPVSLLLSLNGGKEFHTVSHGLPSSGAYPLDFPRKHGAEARIKITLSTLCGEKLSRTSDKNITIDCKPPRPLVTGPTAVSEKRVQLQVDPGPDPLASLSELYVYVRKLPLGAWKKTGHTLQENGPQIKLSDGKWHVFIGGVDEVGNRTPPPAEYDTGATILVDTIPPVLKGSRTPGGLTLKGGSHVTYDLTLQDENPAPFSLSFKACLTGDSTVQPLKESGRPVHSPCRIRLPRKEGVWQVFFRAKDLAGNRTTWSDMINLTLPEPGLALEGPQKQLLPGGSKLKVAWRATNPGSKPSVSLYLSMDNGSSWKLKAEGLNTKGETHLDLPNSHTKGAMVKAVLENEAGKAAAAELGPFAVSSRPPKARIPGDPVLQPSR